MGAGDVFMRYGIKSVNMDDVARELKMSKKTLYKYVRDKLDLVCQVMKGHCDLEVSTLANLVTDSENAIDELILISNYVSGQLNEVHPSIHYDLQKYYPEAWEVFYEHKNGYVLECVMLNLKRGIEEGLYRENINAEILSRLYVAKIDMVFDPAVFPTRQFRFSEVHREMVRYHIRGIASDKGIEYLQERIKKDHTQF